MSDLSGVFKIVNLTVGALSIIGGVTQLLGTAQLFLLGLYLLLFGILIILLEFKIPPLTYRYASFLFSFLGRGVFYILIGTLIAHDQVIRFIFGLLVALVGIVYVGLEYVPSIEAPDNFRAEGHVLTEEDVDDII